MSYIDSQIRELREIAEMYEGMDGGELLKECADTIESLYKKLNEKSNGGWIPCSERLPEKKECGNYIGRFLVTVYTNKLTTLYMEYEYTTIRGKEVGRWLWNDRVNIPWEVIAWQPLPEAYHE